MSYIITLIVLIASQLSSQANGMTRNGRIYNRRLANPNIVYNCASIKDINGICKIYDEIEQQQNKYKMQLKSGKIRGLVRPDATKIVIFPKPVRRQIIHKLVRQRRIFVAKDLRNGQIVGMVKIFVIEDKEERNSILENELRAIIINDNTIETVNPIESGIYTLAFKNVFNFSQEPQFDGRQNDQQRNPISPSFASSPQITSSRQRFVVTDQQTYIYYGGALTIQNYRGLGINTRLQIHALKCIFKQVIGDIDRRKSNKLFYIYGQVDANTYSKNSIRVFVEYSTEIKVVLESGIEINALTPDTIESIVASKLDYIRDTAIPINYHGFEAFRPILFYEPKVKRIIAIDPDELEDGDYKKEAARGIGKFLCTTLGPEGFLY